MGRYFSRCIKWVPICCPNAKLPQSSYKNHADPPSCFEQVDDLFMQRLLCCRALLTASDYRRSVEDRNFPRTGNAKWNGHIFWYTFCSTSDWEPSLQGSRPYHGGIESDQRCLAIWERLPADVLGGTWCCHCGELSILECWCSNPLDEMMF